VGLTTAHVVVGTDAGVGVHGAFARTPARAAFHGWCYAPVPASLAMERPSSSPLR
jgi:hypothetical protein